MEIQTEKLCEPLITIEEEILKEEQLSLALSLVETPEEAQSVMREFVHLAEQSENLRIFPKIEQCVNILKNPNKDMDARELIIFRVVNDLFVLLNSNYKKGEIISQKQIKEVANLLGDIIIEYDENDKFREKCVEAFIETIILTKQF